jgi:fatty-acyl-CoA synthase
MQMNVDDRQQALEARHPVWKQRTLDQALAENAINWPDRDFVVTDEAIWSYRQLDDWATRLAHGLVDAGVQPGDHVAVLMANYPEFVAIKFAISRVGATAVPVNFLNRLEELTYVLEQSDARCLVTMDRFRGLDYLEMLDQIVPGWKINSGGDKLPELRSIFVFPASGAKLPEGVRSFSDLDSGDNTMVADITADPLSVSDIIYTSGTTGGPKGVILTHDMLLRTAYGSAFGRAFQHGRRILFSLPMYHVFGYVEGLLAALIVGGAGIIQLQFDPAATMRAIRKHRADDILLIPTMTLALLDELERNYYPPSGLSAMLSSGGKAPPEIWDRIFASFGDIEVVTGYGMSEATASSTVTRPDDPMERLLKTNGRIRDVGVVGDPDNDGKLVAYRVVDTATGKESSLGTMGELRMKGIGVTMGYYNKPVETADAFDKLGWFRTGDLGAIDSDGYITLMGRTKESYRCGGELVLPLEVEKVIASHPGIIEAHVVAIPDARMGEVGVACVITSGRVDADELLQLCNSRLARFKVPRHVLFIASEEVPTTATGRPRKFLLAKLAQQKLGIEPVEGAT